MSISIIVAMAENRVIGRAGKLPWRLPADMRRFRELTTGHAVIMGRRTFESIGRPLPERLCLVLSRNRRLRTDALIVAPDLETALEQTADEAEVFVIGGAAVYAEALPLAERMYITMVHAVVEGDTYFPGVDWPAWRLIEDERFEPNDRHEYAFSFRTYERIPVAEPGVR